MKQCDLTKGFVVFLTIMITFFFGLMPSAWANGEPKCDKDCFEGFYGFTEKGSVLINFTIPPVPIASVGSMDMQWDNNPTNEYGSGSLTGTETTNFVGCCFEATISGNFEMTAPCTGTAIVTVTPPTETFDYFGLSCVLPPLQPLLPLPPAVVTFSFVLTGEDDEAEIRTLTTQMTAIGDQPLPVFIPFDITGIAIPQDD